MLYKKLREYSESGVYPFHMPGHKRNFEGSLPYELDLTEIDGFDYLHDPHGCIRDIERRAERLFSAKRAYLLMNGATGGIFAAVRALTMPGDKIIMARNCHKSVYNAAEICALDAAYCVPGLISGTDIFGSVAPEQIEAAFEERPDTKLVIITSPTYEGVCSDVAHIAEICHAHGAWLLVDEAHGAHFPFSDAFPDSALGCGADVTVVSLHKTLPSPTQTALLLTNDTALENVLQDQLSVFESSSPSYLLMCGIEKCLEYVENNSFKEYLSLLKDFYDKTKALKKLSILGNNISDNKQAFDYDPGKLVITAYGCDLTGRELADILRERYKLETEMSGAGHVIAMTSLCDTKEGFERLADALCEIDSHAEYSDKETYTEHLLHAPEVRFTSANARLLKKNSVPFKSSAGMLCMEYVYAYPPGIPLAVPGEVIGGSLIEAVGRLNAQGTSVTSTDKKLPDFISAADL